MPAEESLGIRSMLRMNEGCLRSWSNNNLITQQTILRFPERRVLTYRSITDAEHLHGVYSGGRFME